MTIAFSKEDVAEALPSIKRYAREELELELSDLRAKFLLDYFLKELAPLAYNHGVKDAERFFREKIEDLPGVCFADGMTYWSGKRSKPGTV